MQNRPSVSYLSRPSNNRILPTTSSPRNLLPTNSRILELRRGQHIIRLALSSLIIGAKAPAKRLVLAANNNTMIRPRSCEFRASHVRDGKRYDLCRAFTAIVVADLVFGKSCGIDAHLIVIAAAESETGAVLGNGHGVEASAGDPDDFIIRTLEVWDFGGDMHDVCAAALFLDVRACLTVAVQAPGPDLVFVVDCEGVVVAAGDVANLLTTHTERGGDDGVGLMAFDGAVSELALRVGSPAVGVAVDVDGKCAVGSADDAFDLA